MFDTHATHATHNAHRAQLLRMAAAAQRSLAPDEPADFWYRQGIRDAHAYAAALLVTGRAGDVTRAAADRVTALLGEGVSDVGVLMEATDITPRPPTGLSWVGQAAFARVARHHPGIDHDLGCQWGARRDIRISHRLTDGVTTGLLYVYDRTWDEYAVLDPAAHVQVVTATFHEALGADAHLPLADFVAILRKHTREHTPTTAAQPDSPGVQL